MCGIAGIYNVDNKPVSNEAIRKMTEVIRHRGPDGSGIYRDGNVGLGHRRLSILDLSDNGVQPLTYGDGKYWIVFNGEIYNFLEIRRDLTAKGHRFRSETDTEVLVAAYAQWGADCLTKFNGMWAFAIYDRTERVLFLSRDRFGIKPLYYAFDGKCFLFGSEMKALLAFPDRGREVSGPNIRAELQDPFSLEGGEETLWKGIKRLEPGHSLIVKPTGVRKLNWWSTRDHLRPVPSTLEEQAEEFRSLFLDAVRLRMRSDVPIATCLSGGLDSSSVACAMSKIFSESSVGLERTPGDWQRAFVHIFPETPLDEKSYADEIARHAGIKPVYIETKPEEYLQSLEKVVYHSEDLYGGLLTPAYNVYKAAREHAVKVTLDGHGADEMMAGYNHYVGYAMADAFRTRRLRRYLRLISMQLGMIRGSQNPVIPAVLGSIYRSSPFLQRLYPKHVRNNTVAGRRREGESEHPTPFHETLRRNLYFDFHKTILPAILRNFDRMSMAHGVEVRMPFMDWRLVTYVFSLPSESLIGRGHAKLILKWAMGGILPESIRWRKRKIGFNAPMVDLFRGPLRSWIEDMISSEDFLHSEFFEGTKIRSEFQRKSKQGMTWDDAYRLWPFINLALWTRLFLKGPMIPAGT
ncbi:MAG TPA: asparagine synthase (glutamine-hydrolyzing) [Nitrospiria bacterium]|nr:asparagine synthase (glutamine-hydrolyzing) [Nitrospiria bacterium]